MTLDVLEYVATQKELLQFERECERDELAASATGAKLSSLEASGLAITRLHVQSISSDLGGRQVVHLATHAKRRIIAARLSTGDIVVVQPRRKTNIDTSSGSFSASTSTSASASTSTSTSTSNEGVIIRMDDTSVEVALDTPMLDEIQDLQLAVIKTTSDVTFNRYVDGLSILQEAAKDSSHHAHRLVRLLLSGDVTPQFNQIVPDHYDDIDDGNNRNESHRKLNTEQQQAVNMCLQANDLYVIHGPPGTGKTHTLISYIIEEVLRPRVGNKRRQLLVVAPSNVAVDNIAERLAFYNNDNGNNKDKISFIRTGHPARISEPVLPHTLDAVISQSDEAALARDVRSELTNLLQQRRGNAENTGGSNIRSEIRTLRRELRDRERNAVSRALDRADVVLATVSGAGARVIQDRVFDVVVIDEAAQAMEAGTWMALMRGRKAILAGDPHQLGATVKSANAQQKGLGKSILDRVFERETLKKECVTMLTLQYRMHDIICRWSSEEFYGGELQAHESVAQRDLTSLPHWKSQDDEDLDEGVYFPFIVIDTAGGDCEEEQLGGGGGANEGSRRNAGEAGIVKRVVTELMERHGIRASDVGVISPYAAQVDALRREFGKSDGRGAADVVEVSTIDAFQGREKEVICMSLVRSNEGGEVGFLADERRLNVAVTRAKRSVIIVLDSETVCTNGLFERLVKYSEEYGCYRSAVVEFTEIVGTLSHLRRPREAIEAAAGKEEKRKDRKDGGSKGEGSGRRTAAGRKQRGVEGQGEKDDMRKDKIKKRDEDKRETKDCEVEERRSRLRGEIEKFLNNELVVEKWFSIELSALERRMVHEIAEEMEIGHSSRGGGSDRQVKIWKGKRGAKGEEAGMVEEAEVEMESLAKAMEEGMEEGMEKEVEQEWSVADNDDETDVVNEYTSRNGILGELRRLREDREGERETEREEEGMTTSLVDNVKNKKKKKKKKQGKNSVTEQDDDDFETTLRKYGCNSSEKANNFSSSVAQIVNGVLVQTPVAAEREERQRLANANKLADRLSELSNKRKKKGGGR